MDKVLKAASIAWNPVGEARRRMSSGQLTPSAVLAPFVGIVVACNLFVGGAQGFFNETLIAQLGGELPTHPLLENDFAVRMLSALGVLVPVGAVGLLPRSSFQPAGRASTLAAMIVVAAGWAFYAAVISAPVYLFSGALVTVDPNLGAGLYALFGSISTLVIVGLTIAFWLKISSGVLRLGPGQIAGISVVAIVAAGILTGFFLFVFVAGAST